MITLEQAKANIGGLVAYRPRGQHEAPEEFGRVVRTSAIYVFVEFVQDLRPARLSGPQACYPEDLRFLDVGP